MTKKWNNRTLYGHWFPSIKAKNGSPPSGSKYKKETKLGDKLGKENLSILRSHYHDYFMESHYHDYFMEPH